MATETQDTPLPSPKVKAAIDKLIASVTDALEGAKLDPAAHSEELTKATAYLKQRWNTEARFIAEQAAKFVRGLVEAHRKDPNRAADE